MPAGRSYAYGWHPDKPLSRGEQVGGSYASRTHLEDVEALERSLVSLLMAAEHFESGDQRAAGTLLLRAAGAWADAYGQYAIDYSLVAPIEGLQAREFATPEVLRTWALALRSGEAEIRRLCDHPTKEPSFDEFEDLLRRLFAIE